MKVQKSPQCSDTMWELPRTRFSISMIILLHIQLLQSKTQVYMHIEILPSAMCFITHRHFICYWTNISSDKETNWSMILRINGVTGDKCMHQFYCLCAGSSSCNFMHVSTCGVYVCVCVRTACPACLSVTVIVSLFMWSENVARQYTEHVISI